MPMIPQNNEASQVSALNNTEDLLIFSAQTTARNLITDPTKMIPVPKYLLRGWNGWLTPSVIALIIGARQAGYISKVRENTFARRAVSSAHIGYWCGLKKQRVSKILMGSEDSYLKWFISKESDPAENTGLKNEYDIRVNYPLSPHDLGVVYSAIKELFPKWRIAYPEAEMVEFVSFLENQIESQGIKAFEDDNAIPEKGSEYVSVQQMLSEYFNNITLYDTDACEEFEAKFTRPLDNFAITHYFIRHWLPEMSTSNNFIFLYLLRLKSYTSSNLGHVYFKSKNALAEYLHADSRTVSQLLENIGNGKSPLASFIKIVTNKVGQGIELMVSMIDPVHPKHYSEYKRIYSELIAGKSAELVSFDENNCDPWIPPKTKFTPGTADTIDHDSQYYSYYMATFMQKDNGAELLVPKTAYKMLTVDIQNVDGSDYSHTDTEDFKQQNVDGTHITEQNIDGDSRHNVDGWRPQKIFHKRKPLTVREHSLDGCLQNVVGSAQKVDATIKLNKLSSNNKNIKQQQLLTKPSIAITDSHVVVVNGWDINKILDLGGIPNNELRNRIIQECKNNPKSGEELLARWLFASTRKKLDGEDKGVVSPEWMALKQYKQKTERIFLELAKISPQELYDNYFAVDTMWGAVETRFSEVIIKLKKKRFDETLLNFITLDKDNSVLDNPGDNLNDGVFQEEEMQSEKIPFVIKNIWEHIQNTIAEELSNKYFDGYINSVKLKYLENEGAKKVIFIAETNEHAQWLTTRYLDLIENRYRLESGENIEIEIQ